MSHAKDRPSIAKRLRAKGIRYWISVAIVAVLGLQVAHVLEDAGSPLLRWRYALFQEISERGPQDPNPWHTVVVLIGDEEYCVGIPENA